MNGNTAWHKWSIELANSLDRDFERLCLPFLRLVWPLMTQPVPRAKWDQQGIDLMARDGTDQLVCVVQCKSSQKNELDAQAIRAARASIANFHRSPHRCDTYLLVINGDGRNTAFKEAVKGDLEELITSGKAKTAEVWDRPHFLNQTFLRMKQILLAALRERSGDRQQAHQSLFRFGNIYLSSVPLLEEQLILKSHSPCERKITQPVAARPLAAMIQDSTAVRWTLVTGMFGTGKTTAALQAAVRGERTAIVVSARELGEGALRHGTNALMQEMVASLRIFEHDAAPIDGFSVLEPKDEEFFERLAGPACSSLLRSETPEHVLVIDALDENRAYLHPDGLQLLNNSLLDFKCPIVLTTRIEHVATMFGSFETLFSDLATKRRATQPARLLTLYLWGDTELQAFLAQGMQQAESPADRQALGAIDADLRDGSLHRYYGDLPYHPLFLQFILDDVTSEGLRPRNRTQLIAAWVRRKIFRDIHYHGMPLTKPLGPDEFAHNMETLMAAVAGAMTATNDGQTELTEYVAGVLVESLAATIFGTTELSLATILLYSVLTPKPTRRGLPANVGFSLRALQEYFLAAFALRNDTATMGYPASVVELHNELMNEAEC